MTDLVGRILTAASELPAFPRVARKVMELLADPDVGVEQLNRVIELDPALTGNVLKAANSVLYKSPRKLDNLSQAMTFLGNNKFREVVLTSASVELMKRDQPGYDLSPGDLWRHSLATALMCLILCERIGRKPGPALYTAGLMHDVGKIIMSPFVGDKIGQILSLVEQDRTFVEAEREILQIDHAELGGQIAANWRFSKNLISLISFHHDSERASQDMELAILFLANLVCQMYGLGGGVTGLAYRAKESVIKFVGLTEKDLELAMADLHDQLDAAEELLELA